MNDQIPFDMDICSLLQTMQLGEGSKREWGRPSDLPNASRSNQCPEAELHHEDTAMSDDSHYQSDEGSECSIPSSSILAPPADGPYGCAYLQMIRSQIDQDGAATGTGSFPTTGGEYVEAIFTHREIFSAHPVAHRDCARGFSDIAGLLEKRAWRADREADSEAVGAFRYEAWVIANSNIPAPPKVEETKVMTTPFRSSSVGSTMSRSFCVPVLTIQNDSGIEYHTSVSVGCCVQRAASMSAYGAVKRTGGPASEFVAQPSTLWSSNPKSGPPEVISVHHLNIDLAKALPGLIDFLYVTFQQVLDEGRTYPQEGKMSLESFEGYYFAENVCVGIKQAATVISDSVGLDVDGKDAGVGILDAKGARSWEEAIAGFYYVKPNYPGRSSHICNGGFVVPSGNAGRGYGKALGKSYLHYAPKFGYKASVFNLVYVNNIASVRIWESLGFTKAGRIPGAGRLKKKGEDGEEFVDAWVFHRYF